MAEPINRLRKLNDMPTGQPLPAAEVRRLGDRMRRRRNTVTAVSAAAVLTVIATGTVFTSQQMGGTPPVAPSTSIAPTTESFPTPGESPTPDSSPSEPTEPDWATQIPDDFPLRTGLPDPGDDVADWEESRQTDAPWHGLPCPTNERAFTTVLEADAERTDAWTITVQPPAEVISRHLVLYPDGTTAEQAFSEIRTVAEGCGPQEAVPDLTEFRYSDAEVQYGDHPGLLLGGAEYLAETGELTGVSRSMNMLVRVGNAVLLTTLSDESNANPLDLDEPKAAGLAKATAKLADEMCVFAAEPCD